MMIGDSLMGNLKESIFSHLSILDKELNFERITNKSLQEWFVPLLDSFTDDGAVSYLLGNKDRFRASPLSSTIEWLTNSNLIPIEAIDILQNKLIFLRDSSQPDDSVSGNTFKFSGDESGWSLSEGVSVWSTSTALIALLDKYENWRKHISIIKESAIWLTKQRKTNGAWAYQLDENCKENIIMTALAIRALSKFAINKSYFDLTGDEEQLVSEALHNGFIFIRDSIAKDKKHNFTFWKFEDKENCAATTWALLALKELQRVEGLQIGSDEIKDFYNSVLFSSLRFILSRIPKHSNRWETEQIVFEGGAKYNKQKNYQSFSATLLPQLFELGVSPYQPRIINQIQWLIDNPSEWKIETYNRGNVCTFTYAMVLSTIADWISKVGIVNAEIMLKKDIDRKERIIKKLLGQISRKTEPYQMVLKSRLLLYAFVIFLVFGSIIVGPSIWSLTQSIIIKVSSLFISHIDDIIVNIIGCGIYAVIAGIVVFVLKKIKSKHCR